MEIRRITGPDMRTALRIVREELGADAIILSNRRVPGGVEVVAGPGEDFGVGAAAAVPSTAPAPGVPGRSPEPRASAPVAPAGLGAEVLGAVREELRGLRALVEEQLGAVASGRGAWGPGVEGRAWRALTRGGYPNEMVGELLAALGPRMDWEQACAALRGALAAGLRGAGDAAAAGGILALIGPTGAGKTTTLCKLAVRHAVAHGTEGLALGSYDTARLGGADMLRALARLLDVPFLAAAPDEDARLLFERAGRPALMLLDTAGIAARRRETDIAVLRSLARGGARSLLVLPANAQSAFLEAALADYRAAAPEGAVLTKLDESGSLGEVLGLVWRERLPVAYLGDGQDIPEDLQVAEPGDLAARAIAALTAGDGGGSRTGAGSPARPAAPGDTAVRIA